MPSETLSPDNDYNFPPPPASAKLDREQWNAAVGDIGARLRALEAKRTELQDVIDDLRLFGLERLDTAIVPLIEDTQAQLATLQQAVADTIAQNDQIIADFRVDIAAALDDLNAQIAAVEARVDEILNGGIPAADVAEDESRVFVTPAQKAEIGQLRTDLQAFIDAYDAFLVSLAASLAELQPLAEKGQPGGYPELGADGVVPAAQLPPGIDIGHVIRYAGGLPEKSLPMDGSKYLISEYPDLAAILPPHVFFDTTAISAWPDGFGGEYMRANYNIMTPGGHHLVTAAITRIYVIDMRDASMQAVTIGGINSNYDFAGGYYDGAIFHLLWRYQSSAYIYRTLNPVTLEVSGNLPNNIAAVGSSTYGPVHRVNGKIYLALNNGVMRGLTFNSMQHVTLPSGMGATQPGSIVVANPEGVLFNVPASSQPTGGSVFFSTDDGVTWQVRALTSHPFTTMGSVGLNGRVRFCEFNGAVYHVTEGASSQLDCIVKMSADGLSDEFIGSFTDSSFNSSDAGGMFAAGGLLLAGSSVGNLVAINERDRPVDAQQALETLGSSLVTYGLRSHGGYFDQDYGAFGMYGSAGISSAIPSHDPVTEFRTPLSGATETGFSAAIRALP